MWPANRSSDQPEKSWIELLKKPGSIAKKFTSPMRSNISNGSHAANVASIRNRTRGKSQRVALGSKRSCDSLGRNYLSFSARRLVRRSSGVRFESRASEGDSLLQSAG